MVLVLFVKCVLNFMIILLLGGVGILLVLISVCDNIVFNGMCIFLEIEVYKVRVLILWNDVFVVV